jgi:predicted TIM-barrel fold metal-dependent hydrolase
MSDLMNDDAGLGVKTNFGRVSAIYFLDNARTIADLTFGGICDRFQDLRFVSVESGAGWIPSLLEALDWQWQNSGVREEHPEYDLLPSEYFRRQIYGCFWFEREGVQSALRLYPENLLYETDYPHPTCMAPSDYSPATHPREYAGEALGGLPDATLQKVLHDNAAALYGLD